MPDITEENKKYFAAVLQSVADLHKTETEIENDKVLFSKFTDFLTKNADEIGKFHAVENEIVDYLQKFSFAGNADFTPVKNKLMPLPPIRQKLMEMGEEAKKLVGFPDRYNCHKAVEVCKNLAMFCVNEMKSADYPKVKTAIEQNIPKLQIIQKEFEKENRIITDLTAELQKLSAQIKNYANRFQKDSILANATQLLSSAKQKLFNSFDNTQAEFKQNISALKSLIVAFDKEQKDTVALCDRQKKKPSDIWQEDNEQIIAELDTIIKKGTEKQVFSLQNFHNRIQSAASKKTQDIDNAVAQFRRLRKKSRKGFVIKWRKKYINYSQFIKEMNVRKKFFGHTKIII